MTRRDYPLLLALLPVAVCFLLPGMPLRGQSCAPGIQSPDQFNGNPPQFGDDQAMTFDVAGGGSSTSLSYFMTVNPISVTSDPSCGQWSVTVSDSWITLTGGSSGTGDGTTSYLVAANQTAAPRMATITFTWASAPQGPVSLVYTIYQSAGPVVLPGPYRVDYLYNAAGEDGYPNPYNNIEYLANGQGPYYLSVSPGAYIVQIAGLGPQPYGTSIWIGDNSSGTQYSLPSTLGANTIVTVSQGQNLVLYAYDWWDGDNDPNAWADVTVTPVPTPVITSLVPGSAMMGGPAFTLTVNGSGFVQGAVLEWNGQPLNTTLTSGSQLAAAVSSNLIAVPGSASITVVNPGALTSAQVSFPITVATPVITSLTPSPAVAGSPFTLSVNGANFLQTAVIAWNGTSLATTYISPTSLSAAVPASLVSGPGTASITVTNPYNASSGPISLPVNSPTPVVTARLPIAETAGGPAFTLLVYGRNFLQSAVICWNGLALATAFVTSTQLSTTVAASLIALPGTVEITVVNPGNVASGSISLPVNAPTPAITSLAPASATAGIGTFTLTVNGSRFLSSAIVMWNGVGLVTTSATATQMMATVPSGLVARPGSANITVENAKNVLSTQVSFPIIAPTPVVTGINPNYVEAGGGSGKLTVYGEDFLSGAVVAWNGSGLTTTVVSATQLTANIPSNLVASAGSVSITVVQDGVTSNAVSLRIVSVLSITTSTLMGGMVGANYSQTVAASGGSTPYTWSLAPGASLPQGLSLNSATGQISGTPAITGASVFTIQVTDINSNLASKSLTLAVAAALSIATPSLLTADVVGLPYAQNLTATGGAPPYSWSVTSGSGSLPSGLSLNPSTGAIAGNPTAAGASSFTVQVRDANQFTLSRTFSIVVSAAPSLNVSGPPATALPQQQIPITVELAEAMPVPLSGQLQLAFTPDPSSPVDDPAVQFNTGGRSVSFQIDAGQTAAVFPQPQLMLQTGTVAGTLQLSGTVTASGSSVSLGEGGSATVTLPRQVPTVTSVSVETTASGFNVLVAGYSNTREVAGATFQFTPANGSQIETTNFELPVSGLFQGWYSSPGSADYGSTFQYLQPFNFANGAANMLQSVTVTLRNSEGTSAPITTAF